MTFNDIYNQFIKSTKENLPVDVCTKQNEGSTLAHQKKAKNQQELMKITIKALEYYRDEA